MRRARKNQPPRTSSKKKSSNSEGPHKKLSASKKASGRSLSGILINIAMISGFSAIIGALFTFFTSMYLADTNMGDNAQSNVLFIVFLSSFVIAAIPMAMVFLGKESD